MVSHLLVGLGTALGRNLFGWIKNSISDGEIQEYEYKQLVISSLVTLLVFLGGYYGLSGLDLDNAELWSSIVSLLVSPLFEKLVKKKLQ